jgi:guanylate kinase
MRPEEGDPIVVVLHGPSGAGKDSVVAGLRERAGIYRATSSTDRKPRRGEQDGVDYHFLSTEEFKSKIAAGDFLEYATVYGDLKGLERSELELALSQGTDVVIRTDVKGAGHWRSVLPSAVTILLVGSDEGDPAVYQDRLEARRTEDVTSFRRRVADLEDDLADRASNDYVVVNRKGELDAAVDEIIEIIKRERLAGRPAVTLPR